MIETYHIFVWNNTELKSKMKKYSGAASTNLIKCGTSISRYAYEHSISRGYEASIKCGCCKRLETGKEMDLACYLI